MLTLLERKKKFYTNIFVECKENKRGKTKINDDKLG